MSPRIACLLSALAMATSAAAQTPPFADTIVALNPEATVVESAGPPRLRLADPAPRLGRVQLLALEEAGQWRVRHVKPLHPGPDALRLGAAPGTLSVADGQGGWSICEAAPLFALPQASFHRACDGLLLVAATVEGYRTTVDAVTDLLRDRLGGLGESAISVVKAVRGDADREAATYTPTALTGPAAADAGPPRARLVAGFAQRAMAKGELAPALDGVTGPNLDVGRWYRSREQPLAWLSRVTPRAVGHGADPETFDAAVDLLAVPLDQVTVAYRVGTEHPRLDWSKWPNAQGKGPGPDGVGTAAPFARPGMIDPRERERLVAVFAGGFKRLHGALQDGTYYGFVEDGVVLTRLRPGLATLYTLADGTVRLDPWTGEAPGPLLFARQNGIPLVVDGLPGRRLEDRSASWSTGVDGNPRTARGGACVIEGERRWLVYAYLSAAIPRTMSDVFVAYGCRTAMLLDMSRAPLAYAALHGRAGHAPLNQGMRRADPAKGAKFVDQADERDFFAVMVRDDLPTRQ
jgi:hypothetical protein